MTRLELSKILVEIVSSIRSDRYCTKIGAIFMTAYNDCQDDIKEVKDIIEFVSSNVLKEAREDWEIELREKWKSSISSIHFDKDFEDKLMEFLIKET